MTQANQQRVLGFSTSLRDGEVILRKDPKKGFGNDYPFTVHELVVDTATKFPDFIAVGTRKTNEWETITYIEYYELCRKAAKSLLKLGLERFHGVGILGHNCLEWLVADIASIFAGGIAVGIFPTNSSQACRFIAENSEANIIMVEDDWQLQKILKIRQYLNHLKAIVQYKDKLREKMPGLYTWQEFLEVGKFVPDETLDRVIDSQKPNQCCTLIYTAGTTGSPRAVMISHDNITWTSGAVLQGLSYSLPPNNQEILVSYLPLCLISAQMFEVWIPITIGASLFFAEPDAMKVRGSLINTLREVRPTSFCGAAGIWEEFQESMNSTYSSSTPFRKGIINWAKKVGYKANTRLEDENGQNPVSFRLAKKLVFDKVRKVLGFDRCIQFLSIGSGITKEMQEFFLSYDIILFQTYGMTETTGAHSASSDESHKWFSCGKPMTGSKTQVRDEDREGLGEFHIWGRNVSMGYLNNEHKTKRIFDNKGWLHTGDVGFLDPEGYLHFASRLEDVIMTSRGERIFPVSIENMIKEQIPIVHYAMVVGNQARFLCALLTLKCLVNEDTGEPRHNLTPEAIEYCRKHNSKVTKVTELTENQDPSIDAAIQKGIDAVNKELSSESHKIQKWKILEKDFSMKGGELGPTMKLRRTYVTRRLHQIISSFYK
ncbi:long-chain-fatty-acid--CoA ligase ACSBG2-like isoform X2 [Monodelphis domestica]|uniref:long-chain-fatty-acid--CoA ligase ACSBG2-like isoform X2 n=1 Tax=Monodelphis domestica TaxID=13616 RepID=UPI00044333A3|nr:long-chain-fatty-acid--CoA ligase ACSBG2-like isoform X2 [Monodelphis domestica]